MKKALIGIVFVFMLFIMSAVVLAAPGVPHQFYGTVTVNGVSAPNNLFIEAKIGTSVYTTVTKDGKYGYDPIFYVEDPNANRQGAKVEFFVEGVKAGQFTFDNGKVTKLDLSASGVDLPGSTTPPAGGGGGGAGGAGTATTGTTTTEESDDEPDDATGEGTATTITSETEEEVGECIPNWVCSDWTECINYQQRRVCVDRAGCVDDSREERQSCEMEDEESFRRAPGETERTGWLTGFFAGDGNIPGSLLPLLVLVFIVAAALLFVFFSRKKRAKGKTVRGG